MPHAKGTGCLGKRKYYDYHTARVTMRRWLRDRRSGIALAPNEVMAVYRCRDCGWYHLGTRAATQAQRETFERTYLVERGRRKRRPRPVPREGQEGASHA